MKRRNALQFSLMSLRAQAAFLVAVTCLSLARVSFAQTTSNLDLHNVGNAPPQVTVLEHELRYESRLIHTRRGPLNLLVRMAAMKLRNDSDRKIAAVSWYFVVLKNREEEYFRLPYTSFSAIDPNKSKTLKGFFRVPRTEQTQTITVDDLKQPPRYESVVIVTCIMFSDGAVSALNDSAKADCDRLRQAKQQ